MTVCFVDIETTGLDPDLHEIWEIGLIVDDAEHRWILEVDVLKADPMALAIGRFHERHFQGNAFDQQFLHADGFVVRSDMFGALAQTVAGLTHGRNLVGAVPSFDEERLRFFLLDHGVRPSWHYHLVDIEALAAGWIAAKGAGSEARALAQPPWKSNDLSLAVGVDPADFDRHTALGDARWAKTIYELLLGQ